MDLNYEDVVEGIELSYLLVFCSGLKEYKRLYILLNFKLFYLFLVFENCVYCQQLNNLIFQLSRGLFVENSLDFYF